MSFLIITKWNNDYTANPAHAPSILTLMINFGLKEGSTDGNALFGEPGEQDSIQKILLLAAMVCVPIMNLVRPLVEMMHHEKGHQAK